MFRKLNQEEKQILQKSRDRYVNKLLAVAGPLGEVELSRSNFLERLIRKEVNVRNLRIQYVHQDNMTFALLRTSKDEQHFGWSKYNPADVKLDLPKSDFTGERRALKRAFSAILVNMKDERSAETSVNPQVEEESKSMTALDAVIDQAIFQTFEKLG